MSNTASVSLGADAAKFETVFTAAAATAKKTGDGIKESFDSAAASVDESATKIDAALEALNKTVDAKVTISGDATERLADVKARIDDLSHAVAEARVRVDDNEGQAQLSSMEAALERLGAKTAKPQITLAGIADTEAKLGTLQQSLAALRDEKITPTVTVDDTAAEPRLVQLRAALAEMSRTVATAKVTLDDSTSRAKLLTLEAALDRMSAKAAKPTVDVGGIPETEAKLLTIRAELEKLGAERVGPKVDTSSLDSGSGSAKNLGKDLSDAGNSASSSGNNFASMAAKIALIGPAAAAAAPAVGGLLAALPAIGAGALSALAALKLGFDGISTAVSALQAPTAATSQSMDALATATNSAAQSAESARQAIVAAQQALGNAISTQANDSISATESLGNAQQTLANTVQAAANAQVSAAQSIVSAQQALASSEQSLGNAQYSETQAQKTLTQARIDARDAITNLNDQVKDGALAQQQAALDVTNAQSAMAAGVSVGPQAAQLKLSYEQAVQHAQDLKDQQDQLRQKTAQANQQGVEGSTGVQSALQGVVTATQAVGNAQQAVGNAVRALDQAQVAGAQQIASAQQAVGNAVRSLGDVQRNNARQALSDTQAVGNAQTALGTAYRNQSFQQEQGQLAIKNATLATTGQTTALQQAMANLTPVGQAMARSISDQLTVLKNNVQNALLPGIANGLKAMQPAIDVFGRSVVSAGSGIGDWFTKFGQIIGQGPGLAEFTKIIDLGQQFMTGMGSAALDVVNGVLAIGSQAGPVIQVIIDAVGGIAREFADWASGPGGQEFINNAVAALQNLGPTLTSIAKLAEALSTTFGPVGTMILGLVKTLADGLAPVVRDLGPTIKKLSDAIGGILTAVIKELGPFLDQMVKALAGPLGDALTKATPLLINMAETILSKLLPSFLQMLPAVAQILPLIADLLTIIAPLIGPIVQLAIVISPVIWALRLAAVVMQALSGPISDLSKWIGGVLGDFVKFSTEWGARWNDIQSEASAAWKWIDQNLVQPFVNFFAGIGGFVKSKFDEVVTNIKAIPGQIADVASTMWNGILDGFKAVINGIIDLWNGLHFTLPKVDIGPIHMGGETIGMPQIPHLAAGTDFFGGGWAITSEKGPELLHLPPGTQVIPTGPAMSMLSGLAGHPPAPAGSGAPSAAGPATVNYNTVNAETNADPYTISRELAWLLKTAS